LRPGAHGGCPTDHAPVPEAIELQPFYHDVKNTIVQPKQVVVGTRYFWEKWAPRLGPTLTVLIVRLRMHCYYNQATQERRDWCFPTQQTLAQEAGISRWTVMRELKRPEARQFVRVQYRSRYDPTRHQTVRISSLYHVAMDDPLIEEDRGKAAALLATDHLLQQAEDRRDPYCGLSDPGRQVDERPVTGKAAQALITDLVLKNVHPATGPNDGDLPHKEELEEISTTVDAVAHELAEERVSPGVARRLASQYPAEIIRQKMELVRELKEQHQELRNPAGFLRKAIEDDYRRPLKATGTENAVPLVELRKPSAVLTRAPYPLPPSPIGGSTVNTDMWELAKRAVQNGMTAAAFSQWLEPSSLLHYEPGSMCVVVPDTRVQRYLEQRLRPALESALAAICGGPTNLEIIVEGESQDA